MPVLNQLCLCSIGCASVPLLNHSPDGKTKYLQSGAHTVRIVSGDNAGRFMTPVSG